MAEYTASDFNLMPNQEAERKLLVTCVNVADFGETYSSAPTFQPVGVGVENSAIDGNADVETITDILGITSTKVKKFEFSQNLDPMTIRGGDPLAFKLIDIKQRSAWSELAMFEVLLIRAYISEEGVEQAYHAELHKGCTVVPLSEGGDAYVDQPIDIHLSNDKVLGTVNGYKRSDTIVFTPNDSGDNNGD